MRRDLTAKLLHVNQIFWLLGTGVALLVACSSPRIGGGVRGQLIDADTKEPIQWAAIELRTTAHCMAPAPHGYSRELPSKEAQTDKAGHFSVGAGLTIAPDCFAVGWTDRLSILAPGYFSEFLTHESLLVDPPETDKDFEVLRSGPIELDRMRYAVELEEYRRRAKRWLTEKAGPIWEEAAATINSIRFQPLSGPGVFATQSGAALDQIVAVDLLSFDRWRPRRRTLILARDQKTGSVFGWTTKGTQVSLPLPTNTGWSLLGAHRRLGYPFLGYNNRIYHPDILDFDAILNGVTAQNWSSVPSQLGGVKAAAPYTRLLITVEENGQGVGFYKLDERRQAKNALRIAVSLGPGRSVSELLAGGRAPIECLTEGPENDSLVVAAHTAEGRAAFLLPWWKRHEEGWKAERAQVTPGILIAEVTACAASKNSLYLAIKDKGIRRLSFGKQVLEDAPFWQNSRVITLDGPGGPKNFTGLAVAQLDGGLEVVYGVAGDEAVYRFTADGTPDQRIELELPYSSLKP